MDLFNPHSTEWLLRKFEVYSDLRTLETAPWIPNYGLYLLTRYDDILFALTNPDIFSSAKGNLIIEHKKRFGQTLGASDAPVHTTLKNIAKPAYSKDNNERITALFREKAEEYLSGQKTINISNAIEHLSAWTVAEMLNYPFDKTVIKNLIVEIQRHAPLAVRGPEEDNSNTSGYNRLFNITPPAPIGITPMLTNIAQVPPSGPGVYKEYFESKNNSGLDFDARALLSGPTLSGASSLTGALQFLTLDLYRENQLDLLLNDMSLIPKAIDESLRFHASTGRFSRTVMQEITIHGVDLKPGDRVALCLESGNRDPNKFPDPDKFDMERDTSGSLAFGRGPHACIALAITKDVMAVYLEILLKHFGKYKVLTRNEDLNYVMTNSGNDDMITNIEIESGK